MGNEGYVDCRNVDYESIKAYTDIPKEIKERAKPCPFCGRKYFNITPYPIFNDNIKEYGHSIISFGCYPCSAYVYDEDPYNNDYKIRVTCVIAKWNNRRKDNGREDISRAISPISF